MALFRAAEEAVRFASEAAAGAGMIAPANEGFDAPQRPAAARSWFSLNSRSNMSSSERPSPQSVHP